MAHPQQQLRMMVYASLLAALTATGAYITIPIGPVPIVLQNLFIMLSGLLLGSRWGFASVAIYLLAGICGLPVFAGGSGGIGRFAGPTGGYLIGFLPAVYVVGLISEYAMTQRAETHSTLSTVGSNLRYEPRKQLLFDIIAMVCGTMIIYIFGVTWLSFITKMTYSKALMLGMLPFLPGDILKIVAAIPIAKVLRPVIHR